MIFYIQISMCRKRGVLLEKYPKMIGMGLKTGRNGALEDTFPWQRCSKFERRVWRRAGHRQTKIARRREPYSIPSFFNMAARTDLRTTGGSTFFTSPSSN